jgi:class 3 adenylate cyclase
MDLNLTRRPWTLESNETWLGGLTRQLQSVVRNSLPDTVLARVASREFSVGQPPTVTLLITDLVDFSRLIESLGDRPARALIQQHNRMLRSRLRVHAGREVAHTGDGIIASFAKASAAIHCAIEMQVLLQQFREQNPGTPLHARIGLHSGRPLPEEGRLFGTAVIVAVRVCNVAEPDSIFVSDAARDLAGNEFAYREQGLFHLKGFTEPHRLHRIV